MRLLCPDRFAIFLFLLGLALFFVPMMVMPGIVSMVAGAVYWVAIALVRALVRAGASGRDGR
ncbi:hypothetical protein [Sphingomonas swuensis]|uniref:hypothetical protein n=1 Tax=Sphingomonas swuensis TaxID=977800 RepID=UPI0031DF6727